MRSTISVNSASSIDVNGAAALADLGSGHQATGRLTAIPIAGCVIDQAVSSKKPCVFATVAIISLISCSNPAIDL